MDPVACRHPSRHQHAWMARDDTQPRGEVLCVACNDCGKVLYTGPLFEKHECFMGIISPAIMERLRKAVAIYGRGHIERVSFDHKTKIGQVVTKLQHGHARYKFTIDPAKQTLRFRGRVWHLIAEELM